MNIIKIHTEIFRSVPFVASMPLERSTWLNLITYAVSNDLDGDSLSFNKTIKQEGINEQELLVDSELFAVYGDCLWVYCMEEIIHNSRKQHNADMRRAIDPLKNLKRRERMIEAKAKGTHTAEQWRNVLDFYDNKCLCCQSRDHIQKDHIVAVARGGSDSINNLQPLCRSCNISKGATTMDYRTIYTHKL